MNRKSIVHKPLRALLDLQRESRYVNMHLPQAISILCALVPPHTFWWTLASCIWLAATTGLTLYRRLLWKRPDLVCRFRFGKHDWRAGAVYAPLVCQRCATVSEVGNIHARNAIEADLEEKETWN